MCVLEPTLLSGSSAILLLAAFLLLAAAAHQFMSALAEVRPYLPPLLREEVAARFALDKYIWDKAVPSRARRRYMRSLVYGSIGCGLIAIVLLSEKTLVG